MPLPMFPFHYERAAHIHTFTWGQGNNISQVKVQLKQAHQHTE
jgi:hypothetical protein